MTTTRISDASYPARSTGSTGFDPQSPSSFNRTIVATRRRTGTRLPHYRKVIEAGGNATTDLTAQWDTCSTTPGDCQIAWAYKWQPITDRKITQGDFMAANGQVFLGPKDPTIDSTFCDNLARAAFFSKLRSARTQLQGQVVIGELRETLHMLHRPAAGLWDSIGRYHRTLKQRKRADPKNWIKGIGDLWLEHAFGWNPFINDIKDAAKAISRINEKTTTKVVSAGKQVFKDTTSSLDLHHRNPLNIFQYSNGVWMWAPATLYERCTVRYKGKVNARTETTQWDNWALFGFTPTEFIPTAWELLPWSFLADYFTNIGDILSSVCTSTADVAFVNRSTIRETFFKGKSDFNPRNVQNDGHNAADWVFLFSVNNPGTFEFTRRLVTRTANSGISFPNLQFNFELSSGQLGNVAALLASSRALHPQNPRPLHRLPGM